jgi:hypothetical protein
MENEDFPIKTKKQKQKNTGEKNVKAFEGRTGSIKLP